MAEPSEWDVVETKPVTADDWAVTKRGSAQDAGVPIPEEQTEAEIMALEPSTTEQAPAAPGEAKTPSSDYAIIGGAAGAVKGLLERYFLSKDKLQREIYAKALQNTLLEAGIDVTKIKDEASLIDAALNLTSQQMAGKQSQLASLEQQAAQFRGMLPPEPPVSTGFPSQVEDIMQAGRASGPKVEGASAASNWMRAMAGQGHQLPESVLAQATDMTKASPTGGQALINEDLARLEKIKRIGGGQYQLAGQGPGQLMLPPQEAGRVTAQQAAQQAATAAQQAEVAKDALKIIQPQIASVQAEISRLSALGRDVSTYTRRLEELRRMEGLAQRALKGGVTIPQQANVGALPRLGIAMGGKGFLPTAGNILSGAGAAYDISEAFDRASNKDPLGAAVYFVSGALNTMAALPPTNIPLATAKGIGTIGSLGMLPVKAFLPGTPSVMEKVRQLRPGELMPTGQK